VNAKPPLPAEARLNKSDTEPFKILWSKFRYGSPGTHQFTERFDDVTAILKPSSANLTGFDLAELMGKVVVAGILDRDEPRG
jgi:hypothetical protein